MERPDDPAGPDGPPGASAREIAHRVRVGEWRAVEVARAHLDRHARVDHVVRALVAVDVERVLAQAAEVDATVARGADPGPLAGVPVAPKDNLDVRGEVTTAGGDGHGRTAATVDAAVVGRLRAAGAVLVGRANMDELAMGASTQTSAWGATRNPWDTRRSPGGSSGGSAAAVASYQVTVSVGTDTGGSVREPASQCGIVGMAPSAGLVPVAGLVPFVPALDRVGPLARDVADARLLLEVLAGRSLDPVPGRTLRVGVVGELAGHPNQPGVRAGLARAVRGCEAAGHDVVEVSLPTAPRALEVYTILTALDALPMLTSYAAAGGRVGTEVARRLAHGRALAASAEPGLARAAQHRLTDEVGAALETCDVLLSPTMPTTAPLLHDVDLDELADPLGAPYTDCWTVVANLAGVPAVSVPAGLSSDDAMPVGVMLMGVPGTDALLLDVAEAVADRPVSGPRHAVPRTWP